MVSIVWITACFEVQWEAEAVLVSLTGSWIVKETSVATCSVPLNLAGHQLMPWRDP